MRVTGRPGLEEGRMGEKGGEERGLKRGWAAVAWLNPLRLQCATSTLSSNSIFPAAKSSLPSSRATDLGFAFFSFPEDSSEHHLDRQSSTRCRSSSRRESPSLLLLLLLLP